MEQTPARSNPKKMISTLNLCHIGLKQNIEPFRFDSKKVEKSRKNSKQNMIISKDSEISESRKW